LQLIDVFGSLLERPLIKQDFQPNYPKVVEMMDAELSTVKVIYDEHMAIRRDQGKMPLHKNMAKVSGSLKWSEELRERITAFMTCFNHIEHP
jgi:dynein heavy chain